MGYIQDFFEPEGLVTAYNPDFSILSRNEEEHFEQDVGYSL